MPQQQKPRPKGRRQLRGLNEDVLEMAKRGDVEALRGVDVSQAHDKHGSTVLHWASGCGQLETCRYLVKEVGIDPNLAQKCGNKRAPLHFAARNGHIDVVRFLVDGCGACPNLMAEAKVSPFQMAAWQLRLEVMDFLRERVGIEALSEPNAFRCYAAHWIALAPTDRVGNNEANLITVASWLRYHFGDTAWTHCVNAQGHTPMHKAAFSGHLRLCTWLRDEFHILDDKADFHGNFAADLALEKGHYQLCNWLRTHCAPSRMHDLKILGFPSEANTEEPDLHQIKAAFRKIALKTHTDKTLATDNNNLFLEARAAYYRLSGLEIDADANTRNANPLRDPTRLARLLPPSDPTSRDNTIDDEARDFEARLAVILLEQPDGLPLSLLRKRFLRTWPQAPPLPDPKARGYKSLANLVQDLAARVVRLEYTSSSSHLGDNTKIDQVILHSKLDRLDLQRRLCLLLTSSSSSDVDNDASLSSSV